MSTIYLTFQKIKSFQEIDNKIVEEIENTFKTTNNLHLENYNNIKLKIFCEMLNSKISNYFVNFNLNNLNNLINYTEKNIFNLNHDFKIDELNDVNLLHENWHIYYVALNLLKNFKIQKFKTKLEKIIMSKYDLLENIEHVTHNHKEIECIKQFYKSQLEIVKIDI